MTSAFSITLPRATRHGDRHRAMPENKPHIPTPDAVRQARQAVGLTQTEAAKTVSASMRAWQQWESGERTMPPGMFELFMLKTRQWSLQAVTRAPSGTSPNLAKKT